MSAVGLVARMGRAAGGWVARHRRWSVRLLLVAALLVWFPQLRLVGVPAWVLVVFVALVPAMVAGVWSTLAPGSYERRCSGPVRRLRWLRWSRRNWSGISRAVGLSVKSEKQRRWSLGRERGTGFGVSQTGSVAAWTDARLCSASASGHVLTLIVRARPGGSASDVTDKAQAIAAMAGAQSVTARVLSPSTAELLLVMRDVLAGVRPSAPVPSPAGEVIAGRAQDGTDVAVSVFQPWHMAIQGATRSGKSALCYGLLGGLASRSDVLVCGLDPSGILLAPFAPGRGREWIATGTADMSAHAHALAGVVAEMDRRIRSLASQGRDKIEDFTPGLPVLLVVLEEYPGLLSAARSDDEANGRGTGEKIAPRIERSVGRLTKEGAKVGVVLLVLAQRMSAKAIDTDDRSNFGLRVTLRVDNGDAVSMLHDGVDRALIEQVRQFPPGMGLIEAPGRPLSRWRSDFTTYEEYLSRVREGITDTDDVEAFTATAADDVDPLASSPDEPVQLHHTDRTEQKPRKPRSPRAPRAPRGEVA